MVCVFLSFQMIYLEKGTDTAQHYGGSDSALIGGNVLEQKKNWAIN